MDSTKSGGSDEPRAFGEDDLTYGSYLKVPELLQLQTPQSDPAHHDEYLFIIIHQTYELWFKLMLHEVENTLEFMKRDMVLRARHFVNRVVEIMRVLVSQIHILETMEPVEFLQFRSRLMPASGFQSVQFRELEFMVGLKQPRYLGFFEHDPEAQATLQARLDSTDLRTAYYQMLGRLGFELPDDVSSAALEADDEAREALLTALRPIYESRDDYLSLYLLTESLIDLDEQLSLWRFHHVRVVERIIGFKRGTGGSSGVSYLTSTVGKKAYPYLWEVRTYLEVPT